LDLKQIKQLIDLMQRSDLTEFAVEEENFKLKIARASTTTGAQFVVASAPMSGTAGPYAPAQVAAPAPAASAPAQAAAPAGESDDAGVTYIKSPMVGTFYRSPSPDAKVFVEMGSKVVETSVACIIEAMKIMNEIQAETKGTVIECLVENGSPVEYGQRLFKVKSA
jgi:acetyl-CoA carboxylase biotin carboxyl carrier protein